MFSFLLYCILYLIIVCCTEEVIPIEKFLTNVSLKFIDVNSIILANCIYA